MDAHSCCCCLQCSPDKDLTTPYTHLGRTEIYSDMLKYCFDINLVNGLGSCGICSMCVERLRDANNFKLQVQSNQVAMLAKFKEYSIVKPFAKKPAKDCKTQDGDEITNKPSLGLQEPQVKFELFTIDDDQDETTLLPEAHPVKQEINMKLMSTQPIKTEVSDEAACEEDRDSITSNGRCTAEDTVCQDVKLCLPCSVNLERIATYSCDICSKHFGAKTALIRHIKTHYECNMCKSPFLTKLCLNRHKQTHAKVFHLCKTYCKIFPNKKTLERHEMNNCDKPYTCDICSKHFKNKLSVKTHIRIIHMSTKVFNCSSCTYSTRLESLLKRHFIALHRKPNTCNHFNADKTKLLEHVSTQVGKKPFERSVCDFKTAKKHFLSSHLKTHTAHKPFQCHICSYRCREKNNLLVYLQTHLAGKIFKCDLCDKKFLNSQSLQDHQVMHDVIQFKCSKCVYQTDRKHNLIRHDTLAHSEKPFHCDQCDYKGSNEQQLTRHIQQHKNKNRLIHVYIKGSEIVSDTVLI